MPKVSVITPAYNSSLFIEDTIKSVQAQTFEDWELIIVDDCSTDKTYDLAKSYALLDNRIIVLQNCKNSGVASSRNKALDYAKGNFIAFLDSDDLWLPDKLEKQIEFMEKNNYVLTYTDYQEFDSKTKKVFKNVIKAPDIMTAKKIYGNTAIGCLTVMVNKSLSGDFHMPNLSHMEDNITWQNILSKGYKAYRLNKVLSLYRTNNNCSLTVGKKKSAKAQWEIYRKYYGFPVCKSLFYFICYSCNAVIKHYF